MRILLVQPWLGRTQHPVYPIGLTVIASALAGHETLIEDLNLAASPLERLKDLLREFRPDVAGFSLRNCDTTAFTDPFSYIPAFAAQLELTAGVCPGIHIMAGGAGFSVFPEDIMEHCREIDCGVTGHGEEIVRGLAENRSKGLFHGDGGKMINPSLDMVDYQPYLPFQENLSTGVEVNRGCDLRCRYCSYPAISGGTVMERPIEDITGDMLKLASAGARHFFLIAPVLNSTGERGIEVARGVKAAGEFTWEAYHTPKGFDRRYAGLLAESGCTGVSISPDGGTQEQLELMGKDYGVDELEWAVSAAAGAGIPVSLNIFPWHGETGMRGMTEAFRNGVRWGMMAGSRLKRLRFGLVRRMPGTFYGPAGLSVSSGIDPGEFVKPPPAAMVAYLVMKRLHERSTTG